ncbi:SMI1/KNR4 family protein [Sphingobacterium sp. LRF_L2]|uniref:SMI1/KNR4 family protein n=1 Tax=Sphingobacterium sp. LRF_L2 TaxID=3369421 RepID=UPI003F608AD6
MSQLEKLKLKWEDESLNKFHSVDLESVQSFEQKNNVVIPDGLKEYFKTLNGTGEEYTDELYEFYSIEKIKKVSEEFQEWEGVPNHQSLVNIDMIKDLFVFANFSFNQFVYAIKLSQEETESNEVYILCGEEYKKIANTFSEFLDLYLSNSVELQFNKEES